MSSLLDIAKAFQIEDPKDFHQNLQLRLQVNALALKEPSFMAEIKALAHNDWHLMFNLFFWTYDPRQDKEPHDFPFITWEYQDEFLRWLIEDVIAAGKDCHIDKARDMGASWMAICAFVFFWLKPESGNEFLMGSRKFEFVDKRGSMDTLIEKVRYLLSRLPQWILPQDYNRKTCDNIGLIRNPETGGVIKGEANNANFGTGGRYKAMLYDEFSKWEETDIQAWTSGFQSTKCRIGLSTPWGTASRKFHELKKDTNILHFTLPWWKHPYKDAQWYAEEAKRCTPLEMAQEVDISYEGAAGKSFCITYDPDVHFKQDLTALEYHPVQRLWDFGFHHPLCLFTQIHDDVQWFWVHVILGKNVLAKEFAEYVLKMSAVWFPTCDEWEDVGDPAGNQKTDKADRTTIQQIYDETGIRIKTKHRSDSKGVPLNVHRVQSAKRFQALFGEFIGSKPRVLIRAEEDDAHVKKPSFVDTQSTYYIHRALAGGLHYPLDDAYAEVYEKDGYFDHLGDVARYGTKMYFPKAENTATIKKHQKQIRKVHERKLDVKESRHATTRRSFESRRVTNPARRAQALGRFR